MAEGRIYQFMQHLVVTMKGFQLSARNLHKSVKRGLQLFVIYRPSDRFVLQLHTVRAGSEA